MGTYHPLTAYQRYQIYALKKAGHDQQSIAATMSVSPATICRELRRNRGQRGYRPHTYGFVFLHPFEDGNGRIHRFLIHNILARRDFTPENVMFPISAVMLKNPADYDASLNAFSRQLIPLVEYTLDQDGRLTVHNDTATWYRYIDMPPQAEALFRFIDQTIDTELAHELAFLANCDATKRAIQNIVDMPDRQIDLFIRFCLQNNGLLSGRKRASHFNDLTDEEINSMECVVQSTYGNATCP